MSSTEPHSPCAARATTTGEGSVWAWDIYWRNDHLHACVPVSNPRHLKALEAHWHTFFSGLGEEATIVDLGTGNGSLAVMAAKFAAERGLSFEIHGVDAAAIDPLRSVASARELLAGIRFHPHTRIEELPFEADSMDAVCGQFALEYAEPHAAVAEIVRVLARQGRFGFLLHARAGALMERAAMHRDQARHLRASGILARLADVFEAIREAGTETAVTATGRHLSARESFEAGLREQLPWLREQPDPELPLNFLRAVEQLYQAAGRLAPADRERLLRDLETRLAAREARVAAMVEAALDEVGLQSLAALFESAGARVAEQRPLSLGDGGPTLGWWLSGQT